jgi:hypothetical protein
MKNIGVNNMDPFTTLDVVRYEQTNDMPRDLAVYYIMSKIILNTHSPEMKQHFKHVASMLQVGIYHAVSGPIDKELFPIHFEIVKGEWEDKEWLWYKSMLNDSFVPVRSIVCCWVPVYRLGHAKELFYLFCEILRRKFGDDANLMCVIDDLLKRLEI